jgi:hypothetical protein
MQKKFTLQYNNSLHLMSSASSATDLVHEYNDATAADATLDGRLYHMMYTRRSYMYEFIMLFIISVIVLSITLRNMASDTVTTGGYIICCIILVLFIISVIVYVVKFMGLKNPFAGLEPGEPTASRGGPVIRIHFV